MKGLTCLTQDAGASARPRPGLSRSEAAASLKRLALAVLAGAVLALPTSAAATQALLPLAAGSPGAFPAPAPSAEAGWIEGAGGKALGLRRTAAAPSAQSALHMDARNTPATVRAPLIRDPSRLPDFALFRECDGCPEMVVVPGGWFRMGSPSHEIGRDEDEDTASGAGGEQVRLVVQRFAISRFETTWSEWAACVAAGGCAQDPVERSGGDNGWGRGRRPIIEVDWSDGRAYAAFVSARAEAAYRLPTEAEWEYAARAGAPTRFSWGEDDPTCSQQTRAGANHNACRDARTRPVGSFRANPWGLFDLHGNVWEWVEDCYRADLAGQTASAHAPARCATRVVRGGAFNSSGATLRSAYRDFRNPVNRSSVQGFRLARDLGS